MLKSNEVNLEGSILDCKQPVLGSITPELKVRDNQKLVFPRIQKEEQKKDKKEDGDVTK